MKSLKITCTNYAPRGVLSALLLLSVPLQAAEGAGVDNSLASLTSGAVGSAMQNGLETLGDTGSTALGVTTRSLSLASVAVMAREVLGGAGARLTSLWSQTPSLPPGVPQFFVANFPGAVAGIAGTLYVHERRSNATPHGLQQQIADLNKAMSELRGQLGDGWKATDLSVKPALGVLGDRIADLDGQVARLMNRLGSGWEEGNAPVRQAVLAVMERVGNLERACGIRDDGTEDGELLDPERIEDRSLSRRSSSEDGEGGVHNSDEVCSPIPPVIVEGDASVTVAPSERRILPRAARVVVDKEMRAQVEYLTQQIGVLRSVLEQMHQGPEGLRESGQPVKEGERTVLASHDRTMQVMQKMNDDHNALFLRVQTCEEGLAACQAELAKKADVDTVTYDVAQLRTAFNEFEQSHEATNAAMSQLKEELHAAREESEGRRTSSERSSASSVEDAQSAGSVDEHSVGGSELAKVQASVVTLRALMGKKADMSIVTLLQQRLDEYARELTTERDAVANQERVLAGLSDIYATRENVNGALEKIESRLAGVDSRLYQHQPAAGGSPVRVAGSGNVVRVTPDSKHQ